LITEYIGMDEHGHVVSCYVDRKSVRKETTNRCLRRSPHPSLLKAGEFIVLSYQ